MDPQESGVIGPANQFYSNNFGPAKRDHYDSSQWALTVVDATATELAHGPVRSRIRGRGQPVVLKPASNGDPLAAFVSIIGHIPLARKILIELGGRMRDYGYHADWWTGTPIVKRQPAASQSLLADIPPFVYELHRLMAFMRLSTRAFGSVDALADEKLTRDAPWPTDELVVRNGIDRFLAALSYAAKETVGGEPAGQLMEGLINTGGGPVPFAHLNIKVNVSALSSEPRDKDVYDAIDSTLWAANRDGDTDRDCFLARVPPILVLRLRPRGLQADLDVDVAAELYVDRYLEQNKDRMKQMRREMAEHRRVAQSSGAEIQSLSFASLGGQKQSAEKILAGAIEHFRSVSDSAEDVSTAVEGSAVDGPAVDGPVLDGPVADGPAGIGDDPVVVVNPKGSKQIAEELEQVLQRLRAKINGQICLAHG
jgi:hypothetical protein